MQYINRARGVLFNKEMTEVITYPAGKNGDYTIPNSVINIGNSAFSYCSMLTSVIIPSSVINIESFAFRDCSGLTTATIPNSVANIKRYAFSFCRKLTSIAILGNPFIDLWSFAICENLQDVYVTSAEPFSIDEGAFQIPERKTLHVPAGAVPAYQAEKPWFYFGNIVEWEPTGIAEAPQAGTASGELNVAVRGNLGRGDVQVKVDGAAGGGRYVLYGTDGQQMATGTVKTDGTWQPVETGCLPQGVYLLRLQGGQFTKTLKLLAK